MISFYPGPSRLHPNIPEYAAEAFKSGILSVNHRSPEFVELSQKTIALFKQKLLLPDDYMLFFLSSATECWEIITQSLVQKKSYHLYNGAFGEKWLEQTKKIRNESEGVCFELNEQLSPDTYPVPNDAELIAITQNETSNGTEVSNQIIEKYKINYPEKLIAIDATSSMGGLYLDFKQGDIWFASVQKCFGLPAGMAVMVCSPKAIQRANYINERNYYNSLIFNIEKMKLAQTTHTPNVFAIFLLMKVLCEMTSINTIDKRTRENAENWYDFFSTSNKVELLVKNPSVRSGSVIALKGKEEMVDKLKKEAKIQGLLLGNGYGNWKSNTFRIANFPAIQANEIDLLKDFLKVSV